MHFCQDEWNIIAAGLGLVTNYFYPVKCLVCYYARKVLG